MCSFPCTWDLQYKETLQWLQQYSPPSTTWCSPKSCHQHIICYLWEPCLPSTLHFVRKSSPESGTSAATPRIKNGGDLCYIRWWSAAHHDPAHCCPAASAKWWTRNFAQCDQTPHTSAASKSPLKSLQEIIQRNGIRCLWPWSRRAVIPCSSSSEEVWTFKRDPTTAVSQGMSNGAHRFRPSASHHCQRTYSSGYQRGTNGCSYSSRLGTPGARNEH